MTPSSLSLSEIWRDGWNTTRKHYVPLLLICFAIFGIGVFGQFIYKLVYPTITVGEPMPAGAAVLLLLVSLVQLVVAIGWLRICLSVTDGQPVSLGDLASGLSLVPKFLAQAFVLGFYLTGPVLVVIAGLFIALKTTSTAGNRESLPLIFTIAGIVGAVWIFTMLLRYAFAQYVMIDQKLGPVQSMKYSAALTKGHKGTLLLHLLLGTVLVLGIMSPYLYHAVTNLLDMLQSATSGAREVPVDSFAWQLAGVGSVFVAPLLGVTTAHFYRRLQPAGQAQPFAQ